MGKAAALRGEKALMAPTGEYHDNIESARLSNIADNMSRAKQHDFFDRFDWAEGLARHCFKARGLKLIKASWYDAHCWLPLMESAHGKSRAESLAHYYNFTFSPVFTGANEKIIRLALLESAARTAAQHCERLCLSPIADEYGMASLTQKAFERAGWLVIKEACDVNHVLPVNGRSFDEYWQSRPGQLRSTVKRKGAKGAVELRIDTQFNEDAWAAYQSIYAKSWKPEEGSYEFLKEIAMQESDAGALRLGLAFIDGVPVAAQFWTSENGVALIHKLAHDEDYIKFSAGTLLSHALFRHVIDEDGVGLVDFGTGNDRYKADWMEEVRPRYRLICYRPLAVKNWPSLAKRGLMKLAGRSSDV